jgi:hypothetical protein
VVASTRGQVRRSDEKATRGLDPQPLDRAGVVPVPAR